MVTQQLRINYYRTPFADARNLLTAFRQLKIRLIPAADLGRGSTLTLGAMKIWIDPDRCRHARSTAVLLSRDAEGLIRMNCNLGVDYHGNTAHYDGVDLTSAKLHPVGTRQKYLICMEKSNSYTGYIAMSSPAKPHTGITYCNMAKR